MASASFQRKDLSGRQMSFNSAPYVCCWEPVSWSIAWTLALYIVTSYCVGYITQQAGLRFLKAWEASAILQTIPLFTTFFALVLLHETPTLLQAGGGVLVIVGGVIVARGERTPQKPAGEQL